MNLIEQLGGYGRLKGYMDGALKGMPDSYCYKFDTVLGRQKLLNMSDVKSLLLKYRRQHNIFEVGDKVVSINSAFIEYQGILNIDFIDKFNLMLSDDSKGFEVNAICGWSKIIRHATDAEIKAGRRL